MIKYTVHQPMLFPPIYLVSRFLQAGNLVWLDRDYAKSDGWHTRFKLQGKGGAFIVPVSLSSRTGKEIRELEIFNRGRFMVKLEKTLWMNYRFPRFKEVWKDIIVPSESDNFSQFCMESTRRILLYLGGCNTFVESAMGIPRPESASTWLADIGVKLIAKEYLCAADAKDKYLNDLPFIQRNINIVGQKYTMPEYCGPSDASMSILDLILRVDRDEAIRILGGT